MKTFAILLLCLCAAAGCSKSKSSSTTPSRGAAPGGEASTSTRAGSEVATGDMRSLLLQLERVHFAYDSDALPAESRQALQRAGELLEKHPEVALYVDGHADERGTTEYNLALGDRRARAVIDYLTKLGVDRDRLSATTFGEERPLVDGEDVSAYAQNRRVEFRLQRGAVQLVLDRGTPVDDAGTPIAIK